MKNSLFLLYVFIAVLGSAQETTTLTLKEAVNLGLENNKSLKTAMAQVRAAEKKLTSTKTLQYPDVNVSGQYLHLFDTTKLDLKIGKSGNLEDGNETSNAQANPKPSYLMLGMANVSMPIFNGFKLRNTIKQSESIVNVSKLESEKQKEDVIYQILELYFSLYKTKKSIEVLLENQKRAEQRVLDFKNFMDNGLLARNDYLRSALQVSNVKLAIEEAQTTYRNLNYQLDILIGLPEETVLQIENSETIPILPTDELDLNQRKDIQSQEEKTKIADRQIKIEKAGYYPSLSLSGGYTALELDQVATVTNATNLGIGLSYNLASIFKNKSKVEEAKASKEVEQAILETKKDQAKIEIQQAYNGYKLAIKKEEVFEEAQNQANENYRIVKDKYDNGLTDTDQLLEADVEQLQAQINKTIGEIDIQLALYNYIHTQGKLTEILNVQ